MLNQIFARRLLSFDDSFMSEATGKQFDREKSNGNQQVPNVNKETKLSDLFENSHLSKNDATEKILKRAANEGEMQKTPESNFIPDIYSVLNDILDKINITKILNEFFPWDKCFKNSTFSWDYCFEDSVLPWQVCFRNSSFSWNYCFDFIEDFSWQQCFGDTLGCLRNIDFSDIPKIKYLSFITNIADGFEYLKDRIGTCFSDDMFSLDFLENSSIVNYKPWSNITDHFLYKNVSTAKPVIATALPPKVINETRYTQSLILQNQVVLSPVELVVENPTFTEENGKKEYITMYSYNTHTNIEVETEVETYVWIIDDSNGEMSEVEKQGFKAKVMVFSITGVVVVLFIAGIVLVKIKHSLNDSESSEDEEASEIEKNLVYTDKNATVLNDSLNNEKGITVTNPLWKTSCVLDDTLTTTKMTADGFLPM